MAPVTIIAGLVLIALAPIGYWPSEAPTALIPGGFGIVLVVLGLLALREKGRMHVMHAAVLVGLIGFLGAGFMAARKGLGGDFEKAFVMQACMATICALFVAMCVRSFIAARKRRQQTGA